MDKWVGYFPIPNNRNKERIKDIAGSKCDDLTVLSSIDNFLSYFREEELHKVIRVNYNHQNDTYGDGPIIILVFDLQNGLDSNDSHLLRVILSSSSIWVTSRRDGTFISIGLNKSYKEIVEEIKQIII